MSNQLNYLNNLNRPNLVDMVLLQKINDGYQHSIPKVSYLYSMVQNAGSATCGLAKDNLFISIVIISLILFLVWCYIEKQRQNALYEKYLQKKLAKSLLSDELSLFTQTPDPINIESLFNDISEDMNKPIQEVQEVQEIKYIQKESTPQVHMTKREKNTQIYENNIRLPIQPEINKKVPMPGNSISDKYMSVTDFNANSYMLN